MKFTTRLINWLEALYMTLPIEIGKDMTLTQRVAAIIQQKNNALTFMGGELANPAKGTIIHKIDITTAIMLAGIIIAQSTQKKLPLSYLLACLDIESAFDPACVNGNFQGSNKAKAEDGYDDGIAQEKLKYLIGTNGIKTIEEARAFALDPTKAIPYMVKVMQDRLDWADRTIAGFSGDSAVLPQFHNRYYLATGAYNFGEKGMTEMLNVTEPPHHCEMVKDLEVSFAKTLGEPSVFADITG